MSASIICSPDSKSFTSQRKVSRNCPGEMANDRCLHKALHCLLRSCPAGSVELRTGSLLAVGVKQIRHSASEIVCWSCPRGQGQQFSRIKSEVIAARALTFINCRGARSAPVWDRTTNLFQPKRIGTTSLCIALEMRSNWVGSLGQKQSRHFAPSRVVPCCLRR
jgi:hypothetical protein